MAVLGYLAKLKIGLRLAFGAHFVHDFSISFSVTPYFFLKISNKMKSLFRQVTISQTLTFFLNQPQKQWLAEKKRGEDKYTKILIS